jgi:hypothetical protein
MWKGQISGRLDEAEDDIESESPVEEQEHNIESGRPGYSDYNRNDDLVGDWPKMWKGQPIRGSCSEKIIGEAPLDNYLSSNLIFAFSSTLRDGIYSEDKLGSNVAHKISSGLFRVQTQEYSIRLINRYIGRLNNIINPLMPMVNDLNSHLIGFERDPRVIFSKRSAVALVGAYSSILSLANEVYLIQYTEDLSIYFKKLRYTLKYRLSAIEKYSDSLYHIAVKNNLLGDSKSHDYELIKLDIGPARVIECIASSNVNLRLRDLLSTDSSGQEVNDKKDIDAHGESWDSKKKAKLKGLAGRDGKNGASANKGAYPPTRPMSLWTPKTPTKNSKISVPPSSNKNIGVRLNLSTVRYLEEESQKVTQMLNQIFSGEPEKEAHNTIIEDEVSSSSSDKQGPAQQALVWGLNSEISSFARLIITKDLWRRDELESLANEHTLMLDGVLEEINEAAFDMFDQALIEGDDPYEVNKYLVEKVC